MRNLKSMNMERAAICDVLVLTQPRFRKSVEEPKGTLGHITRILTTVCSKNLAEAETKGRTEMKPEAEMQDKTETKAEAEGFFALGKWCSYRPI
jgi:hypothetical protein